jgi:hypothetical protein
MTKAMTIRTRREPGYVVVTVAGEVDIATVARLRARLSALAACARAQTRRLFRVTGLDHQIPLARDLAEVLSTLKTQEP